MTKLHIYCHVCSDKLNMTRVNTLKPKKIAAVWLTFSNAFLKEKFDSNITEICPNGLTVSLISLTIVYRRIFKGALLKFWNKIANPEHPIRQYITQYHIYTSLAQKVRKRSGFSKISTLLNWPPSAGYTRYTRPMFSNSSREPPKNDVICACPRLGFPWHGCRIPDF